LCGEKDVFANFTVLSVTILIDTAHLNECSEDICLDRSHLSEWTERVSRVYHHTHHNIIMSFRMKIECTAHVLVIRCHWSVVADWWFTPSSQQQQQQVLETESCTSWSKHKPAWAIVPFSCSYNESQKCFHISAGCLGKCCSVAAIFLSTSIL